jgi:hypothetical protein
MIHALGGLGAFTTGGVDRAECEGIVRTTPAMSFKVKVRRDEGVKEGGGLEKRW